MTHDPRFATHQTAEQQELAIGRTGEPPFLAALKAGRLLGVKLLTTPKRQLARKPAATDTQAETHKAERAALLATQAKLKNRLAAKAELEPLREQKAELTGQLASLQAEADRRDKGGLQGKIRTGEFARGGFKVPIATALTGKTDKPKPKRKRLGLAATIGQKFAKPKLQTTSIGKALFGKRQKA